MVEKGTYLKALLLLMVFSMNTIISSACSLSSVFHKAHHHSKSASHPHSDKKHHDHSSDKHCHSEGEESSSKEDCCSKSIIQLEKLDKAPAKTVMISSLVFISIAAALNDFIHAALFPSYLSHKNFIDNVRWQYSTTIPDLRIVIQSFQI